LDAGRRTLDAEWYAIQTKPRAEEKTVQFLSLKAIPTFLPQILANRRHGSRLWQALDPLFPGYLFAQFAVESSTIATVRWTPSVSKILGDEESPTPVPDDVVTYLRGRTGERGFIVPGPVWIPGMRVRFRSGPLAYVEGIIERPPSRAERVRVLLELLNRSVTVEVDLAELEPV
jgi:transcriptional antiterminator RfaH